MKKYHEPDSRYARGKRLKYLREFARLTIKEAAVMVNAASSTFADWEYGKHNSIIEKRANLLLKGIWQLGIQCNFEWLVHGTGEKPKKLDNILIQSNADDVRLLGKIVEQQQIMNELEYFLQSNPDGIGLTVMDDSMLPTYKKEDVIGGIRVIGKGVKKIIGHDCIIQLNDGRVLLRNLQNAEEQNHYTLLCNNTDVKQNKIMHNVELVNIAPVIWHRRKKKLI